MSQYYWNAFYAEQAHEGADGERPQFPVAGFSYRTSPVAQNTIALNSRLQRLGWDREWVRAISFSV